MAYTYVDGAVRAADYYSELVVKDAGNGRSVVEWRGRFKRLAYWTAIRLRARMTRRRSISSMVLTRPDSRISGRRSRRGPARTTAR